MEVAVQFNLHVVTLETFMSVPAPSRCEWLSAQMSGNELGVFAIDNQKTRDPCHGCDTIQWLWNRILYKVRQLLPWLPKRSHVKPTMQLAIMAYPLKAFPKRSITSFHVALNSTSISSSC